MCLKCVFVRACVCVLTLRVCACMYVRVLTHSVSVCERERERGSVCVCARVCRCVLTLRGCVCAWERQTERQCVCVCVLKGVYTETHNAFKSLCALNAILSAMCLWCCDWHDVLIDVVFWLMWCSDRHVVSDMYSVGQTLSMQDQICNVCRASCLELCKSVRLFLSNGTSPRLVAAFMTSRLDDYTSSCPVFCGSGRLQSVQNSAARLVLNSPSSFLLKSFHIRDIRPILRLSR